MSLAACECHVCMRARALRAWIEPRQNIAEAGHIVGLGLEVGAGGVGAPTDHVEVLVLVHEDTVNAQVAMRDATRMRVD